MAITWNRETVAVYGDEDPRSPYGTGTNWYKTYMSRDGLRVAIPAFASGVISGIEIGVFATYDIGGTWEDIVDDESSVFPYQLAIPDSGENIYVIPNSFVNGVPLYAYNKTSGEYTSLEPFTLVVNELSGNPKCSSNGQYVIIASETHFITAYPNHSVFISRDYGATWDGYLQYTSSASDRHYVEATLMSSDGQNMAVLIRYETPSWNFILWTSDDYGATWTESLTGDSPYMCDMVGDSSLTNIVMMSGDTGSNRFVYVTHDGGDTWSSEISILPSPCSSGQWNHLLYQSTMSQSGQTIILNTQSGVAGLYPVISTDYGETWSQMSYLPSISSISFDFIGSSETDIFYVSYGGYQQPNGVYTSNDLGVTLTRTYPAKGSEKAGSWLAVANSTDGQTHLAIDNLSKKFYKSIFNTYGGVWEETSASPLLGTMYSVATDSDGTNMLLGGRRLYLSDNSGTTWNEVRPAGDVNRSWYGVAMSADGQYMIAGDYDYDNLYRSSDYGASWSVVSSGIGFTDNLACSSDGSFMIGGGWQSLYFSTNYGITWEEAVVGSEYESWIDVACSEDGQDAYVLGDDNYELFHLDVPSKTWDTAYTFTGEPYSIDCSSDASIIVVGNGSYKFRYSSTLGISWTTHLDAMYRTDSVAIDGSRLRMLAGDYFGYVWAGYGSEGGRIKSISGILFENIAKAGGIPISSLKKISGEEN